MEDCLFIKEETNFKPISKHISPRNIKKSA